MALRIAHRNLAQKEVGAINSINFFRFLDFFDSWCFFNFLDFLENSLDLDALDNQEI